MSNRYILGVSRKQGMLLPNKIEDYIEEDSFVELIEAYVETLNLKEMGLYSIKKETRGRSGYDPKIMIKLYIYGYMNNIRSSRKLEVETKRNVELMWLVENLRPDFKTISDFRKNNIEGIKEAERRFVYFLKDIEVVDGNTVGIDGTKIRAVNSKDKVYNKGILEKDIKAIDERIDKYLEEMESNDKREENMTVKKEVIKGKILRLEGIRKQKVEMKEKLQSGEESQIAKTDPDSRMMKSRQGFDASYNVQTAVDSKNKIIVSYDVVNQVNDAKQLLNMAKKVKEVFEEKEVEIIADKGYYNAEEIKSTLEIGTKPLIPVAEGKKEHSQNGVPSKGFHRKDFVYDATKDVYICPKGKEMKNMYQAKDSSGKECYFYTTSECKECQFREKCTSKKKDGRVINHWIHHEILEKMEKELKEHPEKMEQRKCLVEHPFGTIKRSFGHGYFLTRGLKKVKAEFSLTVLAYNMKRAVKIKGISVLKNQLKEIKEGA